ncbi:hypothetical protein R3P38DRAFT_2805775 [Favolaschia claudopus]|uniref:Uncharacterized protein n=1 Tax=Favolaschia claudopus TaxID=2862362 RepID=A0AAV9ZMJ0_9AGAR
MYRLFPALTTVEQSKRQVSVSDELGRLADDYDLDPCRDQLMYYPHIPSPKIAERLPYLQREILGNVEFRTSFGRLAEHGTNRENVAVISSLRLLPVKHVPEDGLQRIKLRREKSPATFLIQPQRRDPAQITPVIDFPSLSTGIQETPKRRDAFLSIPELAEANYVRGRAELYYMSRGGHSYWLKPIVRHIDDYAAQDDVSDPSIVRPSGSLFPISRIPCPYSRWLGKENKPPRPSASAVPSQVSDRPLSRWLCPPFPTFSAFLPRHSDLSSIGCPGMCLTVLGAAPPHTTTVFFGVWARDVLDLGGCGGGWGGMCCLVCCATSGESAEGSFGLVHWDSLAGEADCMEDLLPAATGCPPPPPAGSDVDAVEWTVATLQHRRWT